ncbi:hypothetical protein RHGRI_030193 [Rhododendron griersonianum]|uniref:THIF-type NAD/FAD binding fold domain-containing protein n=1 Tax=Rhododendron griersonianum TaxID=479676 RepID=A0AAV6IQH2_9ERIC|nr:hypothetical protein RHGRI_030193 [Rhododendron griersonianum]
MEEKVKLLALVGAGALLGSVTTIALLRLYTRSVASQSSSKVTDSSGRGFTPEIAAKGHDVCGDRNHGRASSDLLKDEIVSEHLTWNIQFFGIESQHNVSASYVVVIGLGRVGSHAASMLLRSGVGRLLLVDFDQVSVSSLNRHAVATREYVGIPKAHCLKKHFLSIFPECLVEAKVLLYDASSVEEILSGHPDFVLDCIDNVDTKVRHRLRKDYGIEGGIPVVFSLEKPKAKLLPFKGPSGEEENPSDYQVDVEEVMYIVKELWRGRSARDESMKDIGRGMWRSINDLMLVRWDRAKPAAISNLVLLRFKEADEQELQTLEDIKENEPEFFSRVASVLKRAELDFATEDVNFQSVPDLQKSMYKVVDGFPCVRLLNLSGEIGCSSRVSNDVDFAKYVGGVLVESGSDVQNELKGVSMDEKFPQAEFSPYKNISYQWNPIGSGIMWNNYDFPVFLLSDSSTSTLKEAAIKNVGNKKAYTTDVAEFDLVMQGSVWSALPPVNTSSSESSKHIILAAASMDSASFFRDKCLGADSPISLVFVIFTGEAWGFLGSRRFLLELDQNSDAVNGLNSSLIDMVGKVSIEWLAAEKTKVVGTFPPIRKKGWTGYVEKDTAGQTNVYSVEPAVYVAESAISSGTAGSSDGAENTLAIVSGLALVAVAAASLILLQVGKNPPQIQTLEYSGPSLSFYIKKFKPTETLQASASVENETSVSIQTESKNAPEVSEVQAESVYQSDASTSSSNVS